MARSTGDAGERADQPMTDHQRPRPESGAGDDAADQIRRRAYELYQARGGTGGTDMDDWLAAEREVRERGLIAPMGDRGPAGATGVTSAAAGTDGAATAASALGGEQADAGAPAGGSPAPSTRRSRRGRAD